MIRLGKPPSSTGRPKIKLALGQLWALLTSRSTWGVPIGSRLIVCIQWWPSKGLEGLRPNLSLLSYKIHIMKTWIAILRYFILGNPVSNLHWLTAKIKTEVGTFRTTPYIILIIHKISFLKTRLEFQLPFFL